MGFKKADPAQGFLKFSIYGPTGSGKTTTALLFAEGLAAHSGGRIAYIDTERGTDFYAKVNKLRKVHPEAFDFDALYTESLADALRAVREIDTKEHSVLVIDSISTLWDSAIEAYSGRKVGSGEDKIPMHAWGGIKRPYKELVKLAAQLPIHAIVCGRQKNVFEDDDSGGIRKVGVTMKAEGETPYEFTTCLQMQASTGGNVILFGEKDRSSVLQNRKVSNPTFATIEPMLALLDDHQRPLSDDDERIDKDGELHEEEIQKARAKSSKSQESFQILTAMIGAATTTDELGAAGVEAKKRKRGMDPGHLESLRQQFQAKNNQLTKNISEPV